MCDTRTPSGMECLTRRSQDTVKNNWCKPWLFICRKRTRCIFSKKLKGPLGLPWFPLLRSAWITQWECSNLDFNKHTCKRFLSRTSSPVAPGFPLLAAPTGPPPEVAGDEADPSITRGSKGHESKEIFRLQNCFKSNTEELIFFLLIGEQKNKGRVAELRPETHESFIASCTCFKKMKWQKGGSSQTWQFWSTRKQMLCR